MTSRLGDKRTYDDLVVGAAKTKNDSLMVRYKDGAGFNSMRGKAYVWQQDRHKTDGNFVVRTAQPDGEIPRRCKIEQYE